MYELVLCLGMLVGRCTEYYYTTFENEAQCVKEKRSIQQHLKKNDGFALCRPLLTNRRIR